MKVVGVAASINNPELSKKRVAEWGLNFANIADTGEVWRKFGVISQPAFAVVNSKGIVLTEIGHLNLEAIYSRVEERRCIY